MATEHNTSPKLNFKAIEVLPSIPGVHPNFNIVESIFTHYLNQHLYIPEEILNPRVVDKNCVQRKYTFDYGVVLLLARTNGDNKHFIPYYEASVWYKRKRKGSIRRDEPQFIAEQEDEKQKDEKYILYRNKFVNSGMIYRMTNIIGDIIIETMEEIER